MGRPIRRLIRCLRGFYWYLRPCAKYARVCGHIQDASTGSFRIPHCQDDHLYELIEIGGTDAEEFLQGQLTQDVAGLAMACSLPAAWCNPKGRVFTLLRLLRMPDAIGLVVPATLVDTVIQRLTMYRLRADVSIERSQEDWMCVAVADANSFGRLEAAGLKPDANSACSGHSLIAVDYSIADRFVEVFGTRRAFADAGLAFDSALSDAEHLALKIRSGLAEITPENSEKYTPHMLNLDRLGAISFDKGCYTGQEVVARTENLGESKRRLMRYRYDGSDVTIGDKLSDGERDVGTVVNVAGTELLAVTPVAMHEQPLSINGATATPGN
jgi:folate-binding protein YgfZ